MKIHDVTAERRILAGMVLNEQFAKECLHLAPDDFFDDQNRRIYSGLIKLQNYLGKKSLFDRFDSAMSVPDALAIGKMAVDYPINGVHDPLTHIRDLKTASARRALSRFSKRLEQLASSDCGENILQVAQDELSAIVAGNSIDEGPVPLASGMVDELERLTKQQAGEIAGEYIDTEIPILDSQTNGGFGRGMLVVVAARPSRGKSGLGQFIAASQASAGRSVLFVSMEMDHRELIHRAWAMKTGTKLSDIKQATFDAQSRSRIVDSVAEFESMKFGVKHQPRCMVEDIERLARQHRRRCGSLDVVYVDYLQLMTHSNRKLSEYERISDNVTRLKQLAGVLNCVVVCLAQINRAGNDEPELKHLKGSGEIEQSANIALVLHWPNEWIDCDNKTHANNLESDRHIVEVNIEKNRDGRSGETIRLTYDKQHQRFEQFRYGEFDKFNER